MLLMDMLGNDGREPKRGDLVQTNVGDRRERTWFVIRARKVKRRILGTSARFELDVARWWEIEPELRIMLFRSAERRGGQNVFAYKRYARKEPLTFERLMRGK